MSQDEGRVFRLGNGVRVLSLPMNHMKTTILGVWMLAGSRHESEAENGYAHFIEHMLFKGTHRRDARQIAEETESIGASMNAATGYELTHYHMRLMGSDLVRGMDILSDMLRHSVFPEREITLERKVVLQEIAACEENPELCAMEAAQFTAFPQNALGRRIVGTQETIESANRDSLLGWMRQYYRPDAMILAAAGNIEPAQLEELAARYFGDMETSEPPSFSISRGVAQYKGGKKWVPHSCEQLHVVLAWPGVSASSPQKASFGVLAQILGGGMSSRLFQQIREKKGLAYAIDNWSEHWRDTGLFGIYAACSPQNLSILLDAIAEVLEAAEQKISDVEYLRAQAQMRAMLAKSQETQSGRLEQALEDMIYHDKIESYEQKNQALSRDNIRACACHAGEMSRASSLCCGSWPLIPPPNSSGQTLKSAPAADYGV